MTEHRINLEDLRKIRDGSGHSVFGPSGSSMYLNCPGSLIPNLLAPDDGNADAAYGTVAHGVTELWLRTGKRPDHLIGTAEFVEGGEWGYLVWIDEEMLSYAEMCIDWVDFLSGDRFIERRVDFSRITPIPKQTGTADLIVHQGNRLIVADWKFGKGVQVFAERNTQGMLYALGALWEFDPAGEIREIEIRIGQPRLDHFDEWVVSRDDLLEFAGWAKARMALAWQINAPRIPGPKQCQFCKVRSTCAAYAKFEVEMTEGAFENLEEPIGVEAMREFKGRLEDDLFEFRMDVIEAGTLTTNHLCRLRPFRTTAEKWWKGIDEELMRRVKLGEDLSAHGYKLVEGRSNRVFEDPEKAIEHLETLGVPRDATIERKFVSPSGAERLLRKAGHRNKDIPNLLEGLTRKPPGKPTIVPVSDKRPPIADLSGVAFDDLESTTDDEEM